MNEEKRILIFGQYQEGSIDVAEMIEAMLRTLNVHELRAACENGLRFEQTLQLDEHAPDIEAREFAARLVRLTCGLLAESHGGFVATITCVADGTLIVVEQDNEGADHRSDLSTKVHVMEVK
jgi:hypothetical protein